MANNRDLAWGGEYSRELQIKKAIETQTQAAQRSSAALEKQAEAMKANARILEKNAEFDREQAYREHCLAEEQNAILASQVESQERLHREQAAASHRIADAEVAKAQAAVSAARHIMAYEPVCPVCSTRNSVSLPSDGQVNFDCDGCCANITVTHGGRMAVFDNNGNNLTPAQLGRAKKTKGLNNPLRRSVTCPICSDMITLDWMPTLEACRIKCGKCETCLEVEYSDTEECK